MKLYLYGMRLRGFSIGRYHDIICYTGKLDEKDLRDYELDYLGMEEV